MNELTNNYVSLNINYPNTEYIKLNQKIDLILKKYINEFYQTNFHQEDFIYSLNIHNHKYLYKNYISIIFFIDDYTGGAHPNYYIESIVYDINTNKFITIKDLINKNKFILNKLSKLSRENFLKIPVFQDENIKEMLFEGTRPIKNNFQRFAITDNGIKLFFERYQIAPYYYGAYDLVIPFEKLDLNL